MNVRTLLCVQFNSNMQVVCIGVCERVQSVQKDLECVVGSNVLQFLGQLQQMWKTHGEASPKLNYC